MRDIQEILSAIKPYVLGWINNTGVVGSGGTTGLSEAIASLFLRTDGSRTLTGNMPVDPGITIDGVDISALASAPSTVHHLSENSAIGATSVLIAAPASALDVTGWIYIDAFTIDCEARRITSISGGQVFFTAALAYAHATNDSVLISLDNVSNAKWFGLTGLASQDASVGLQRAIDQIGVTGDEGTIFVPPGYYQHSATIAFKPYVTLQGVGYNSLIRYTGAGTAINIAGHADTADPSPSFADYNGNLRHLRIFSTTGAAGVLIKNLSTVTLQDVAVAGFASGVELNCAGTPGATTGQCVNVTFDNCVINGNTVGVKTSGGDSINTIKFVNGTSIGGNTAQGVKQDGKDVEGWAFTNCIIQGNGQSQIYFNGGSGLDISGCYFEGAGSDANINLAPTIATRGVSIKGNIFIGATTAVGVGLGGAGTVYGADISGNAFYFHLFGIYIDHCVGATIGPNSYYGPGAHVGDANNVRTGITIRDDAATRLISSTFAVGGIYSAGYERFLVDVNGNVTKINNVATSWPASQGAASTLLKNDGSGNFSWAAPTAVVGNAATGGTVGSVLFVGASSLLAQDNANLFWDDTGNLFGVGTAAPLTKVQVGAKVNYDNSFAYDANSVSIVHPTPTAAATLNDPKMLLVLGRFGTNGESFGAGAVLSLSRYENSGANSRTRLDISLAHNYFDLTSNIVITLLSSGFVGFGTVAPTSPVHVIGATSTTRLIGNSTVPTVAITAAGAGANATTSVSGTDLSGTITLNTNVADTPAANSDILTLTFNTTYAVAPRVIVTPSNDAAWDLSRNITRFRQSDVTTTTFKLRSGPSALPPTTAATYTYNYMVIQ